MQIRNNSKALFCYSARDGGYRSVTFQAPSLYGILPRSDSSLGFNTYVEPLYNEVLVKTKRYSSPQHSGTSI